MDHLQAAVSAAERASRERPMIVPSLMLPPMCCELAALLRGFSSRDSEAVSSRSLVFSLFLVARVRRDPQKVRDGLLLVLSGRQQELAWTR